MLKRCLKLNLPQKQSLFLWGARKTGKSTYLKANFPESIYYDFLRHDHYLDYSSNPSALREEIQELASKGITSPIILDEIQKIPAMLDEVHWMIENLGVNFILCGSSLRKLKHTGANLLGGRAWRQLFFPLVYPEFPKFDLLRIFNHGLIPSHYLSEVHPIQSLQGYIVDYLIPEIQWESRIRQMGRFQKFLEAASFSNGQMVNFTNIARECGINKKTVQSYFELLVEMLLGYIVLPFTKRRSRQIITSTPKFYFFDTGLVNFLLKREISQLKGAEAGQSFEHYIFLELLAYKELNQKLYDIEYWRTNSGIEVDFILARGKVAIEAKIGRPIQKRDLAGLRVFAQDYKPEKTILVCLEPRPRLVKHDGTEINIMPVEYFLKELWAGRII